MKNTRLKSKFFIMWDIKRNLAQFSKKRSLTEMQMSSLFDESEVFLPSCCEMPWSLQQGLEFTVTWAESNVCIPQQGQIQSPHEQRSQVGASFLPLDVHRVSLYNHPWILFNQWRTIPILRGDLLYFRCLL